MMPLNPPRRVILVALTSIALLPRAALAHAILLDSTPAQGGRTKPGSQAIRLRFNSRIDAARSRLTLIRPDRSSQVLAIEADKTGSVLVSSASMLPGSYVLRWQVLAIDGHITRGDVPFTVTAD